MDSIFEQFLTPAKSSGQENAITVAVPLPSPRCEVNVRVAVADDLPFIDGLQKMHSHMVGFMPKKQLEKYVADGHVLIAETVSEPCPSGSGAGVDDPSGNEVRAQNPLPDGRGSARERVGYVIARDQYMKRDDCGIIYQLNVAPLKQRHLIGATLVKHVFDRAAYGCKLFCCWCAQDIQANWFWESIGFVPIAFRTGSRTKQRVHIFWQKRIREGDESTEYWYPHQTQNGAVAEDRLVLPIPPGTHWRDAKPLVLPGITPEPEARGESEVPKTLPGGAPVTTRPEQTKLTPEQAKAAREKKLQVARSASSHLQGCPPGKAAVFGAGGVKYVDRADVPEEDVAQEEKPKKPKRPRKPRQKHDPKQVKLCRELRDRYLDALQEGRILPPSSDAKYEVARQLEAGSCDSTIRRSTVSDDRLLDAA